ncbi:arabinan endo-1,5-alpha-L-arabinosidase [Enterococcus sp. JM4C]|uniref:arabinan endo-1,5-alpha-L-arabinosidase n=1 Tax=Candidatus Enterococcus huntleyi TaxID=1857217 RepID=UPI001379DC37|nr:arabinan endo-1,5-alpha-L-arabinosidase [Enterococcus sp. JM4C]KAF1296230.1 arabinan endo-1,5-alpha-L-arabinosidase [Enterococcus sp. JM4C]
MKDAKIGVHDPTIIQAEGKYYLYSTDTQQPETSGVPIRSSEDLVHWQFEKAALEGVPTDARSWSQATGLWAPEIIKVKDEYRMYYSASTFGSTTSFIGLAVAKHPLGPWEDRGEVVKTSIEIADHNAIDANICWDRSGKPWMVYGSFFGGIYIAEINEETGKLANPGYGKRLAIRSQSVEGAIEGPFIKYHAETDYFYLFVSFDSLNDFYNIRVARSRSIDGPYVDYFGNEMTDLESHPDQVGTKLIGGYQFKGEPIVYAPGHNSLFSDTKTGREFIVHHARKEQHSDQFYLQIRSLFWLSNGWPAVSAYEYTGAVEVVGDEKADVEEIRVTDKQTDLAGVWELIDFSSADVQVGTHQANLAEWLGSESCYVLYKELSSDQLFISGMRAGVSFFGKKLKDDLLD